VLLAASVAAAMAAALPAAAAQPRVTLPGSHAAWATPQAKVADTAGSQQITFRVYLKLRDEQAALAKARAVTEPDSPSYQHYLSPKQVRGSFAPKEQTVDALKGWLDSAGFSVRSVPANHAYVEASGTAGTVEDAFDTHLGEYRVSGETLRASDGSLSLPSGIGSKVLGVIGVDQALNLVRPSHTTGESPSVDTARKAAVGPTAVPPGPGFRNAPPCSDYFGQKVDTKDPAFEGRHLPYAPCGYKPAQLRSAYGIDHALSAGFDGSDQTVAIVDAFASPTIFADASTYAKRNDPRHPLKQSRFSQIVFPPTPGSEAPPAQGGCGAAGWYGEETLDVEAVHAMAPGADILFVGGSDCQNSSLDKALNKIVAGHLANVVSNSYGSQGEDIPADEVKAFNVIAVQAALEGIGVYFSSGDSGDEAANLGHPSADFSASSPWVTAVGGTSLGVGRHGRKLFETGWETAKSTLTDGKWSEPKYQYGAGGGTSVLFREPFYQKGAVPDALAKHNQTGDQRGRVVPDIAALGDPNTGMLVGQTQTFPNGVHYGQYRIGGTSLACPLIAGIMAVADQFAGHPHGFVNPTLYEFTARTGAVRDVTHRGGGVVRVDYANGLNPKDGLLTSVRTFDYQGLAIDTDRGYDDVTGVGTPRGFAFLALI
jgi:subtilase family serine protease